jgi:hypothetical protein
LLIERLENDEAQIELLKKMGAPKGADGGAGGSGVLEVLNDMMDKLRNTLNDKFNDLSGRITKLQAATTAEDAREQGEIDSLKKLIASYDKKIIDGDNELKDLIEQMSEGKPVEIRRSDTPKSAGPRGPWENITQEDIDRWDGNIQT